MSDDVININVDIYLPASSIINVSTSGRKIYAGTRHYAVLPLSLAVKPLNCAEGARHDLLPCPDCQNISKYGEKSMSN